MQEEGLTIKVLTQSDKKSLHDINKLLLQWSDKGYQMSRDYFKSLLSKSHVIGLFDGKKMVGTVTLVEIHKLSGLKGTIEHLIVDTTYQGRGLGKELMVFAINFAKKLGIEALFLTCEPERKVANALYKKLGFKIKKTNFYQLQ